MRIPVSTLEGATDILKKSQKLLDEYVDRKADAFSLDRMKPVAALLLSRNVSFDIISKEGGWDRLVSRVADWLHSHRGFTGRGNNFKFAEPVMFLGTKVEDSDTAYRVGGTFGFACACLHVSVKFVDPSRVDPSDNSLRFLPIEEYCLPIPRRTFRNYKGSQGVGDSVSPILDIYKQLKVAGDLGCPISGLVNQGDLNAAKVADNIFRVALKRLYKLALTYSDDLQAVRDGVGLDPVGRVGDSSDSQSISSKKTEVRVCPVAVVVRTADDGYTMYPSFSKLEDPKTLVGLKQAALKDFTADREADIMAQHLAFDTRLSDSRHYVEIWAPIRTDLVVHTPMFECRRFILSWLERQVGLQVNAGRIDTFIKSYRLLDTYHNFITAYDNVVVAPRAATMVQAYLVSSKREATSAYTTTVRIYREAALAGEGYKTSTCRVALLLKALKTLDNKSIVINMVDQSNKQHKYKVQYGLTNPDASESSPYATFSFSITEVAH